MPGKRRALEDAIRALQSARTQLEGGATFRARVLIDMLLLELAKELARESGGENHRPPSG